jgi:hypothetical protein
VSTDGSVQPRAVGQAKGLASLEQVGTERMAADPAGLTTGPPYVTGPSRTNSTINIFSQARTNTTINIFREAEAARNSAIPYLGGGAERQQSAMQIDAILQKYLAAP